MKIPTMKLPTKKIRRRIALIGGATLLAGATALGIGLALAEPAFLLVVRDQCTLEITQPPVGSPPGMAVSVYDREEGDRYDLPTGKVEQLCNGVESIEDVTILAPRHPASGLNTLGEGTWWRTTDGTLLRGYQEGERGTTVVAILGYAGVHLIASTFEAEPLDVEE